MSGYISPLKAERMTCYTVRVRGQPTKQRMHYWPNVGWCQPKVCRECYREKNWKEGQTHGSV